MAMVPTSRQVTFPFIIVAGPGEGIFSYSPVEGFGNLVATTGVAMGGTDNDGNAYLSGDTTYTQLGGGQWIATQLGPGGIQWYTAATAAGPWTLNTLLVANTPAGGPVVPTATNGLAFTTPASGGSGHPVEVIVAPSNDTTGVKDRTLINALFASVPPAGTVRLLPGTFYIDQPIIMDVNGQALRGAAWNFTSIQCKFTAAQSAMLITGNTGIVTRPVVADLTLDVNGNANCNHGWLLRAEAPLGSNVVVKSLNSNGDMFHFSPGDLTALIRDTYEMYNLFGANTTGTGHGLYLDSKVTSSEFFGCHFNGALTNAGSGGYGINDNGNGNKFYGCHSYFWTSGGYINNAGLGPLIVGGEYENNHGPAFTFNGTKYGCVTKAQSYGTVNTGPAVLLESGANFNQLDGIRHNDSGVSVLYSLDGTCFRNSIVNAKTFVAIAAAVNAAAGANQQIISLNDFQGGTITHSGAADIVVNNL